MTLADRSVTDRLRSLTEPSRSISSWYTQGHSDALGDRLLMFDNSGTPSLEVLRFKPEFVATFGFEHALRERVHRLQRLNHPAFPDVRAIEYLEGTHDLTLVSTFMPGKRLSDIFRTPRGGMHPAFASWLIREVTPALADLHQHSYSVAHGALTPERIILTPDGRLMIVEHVLAGALERLRWGSDELWRSLDIVAPPAPAGTSVLDSRTDIIQLAWLVLSILLGRRIPARDYPSKVDPLLDEFGRTTALRSPVLAGPLRQWLERALLGDAGAFGSALEAHEAFLELEGSTVAPQLAAQAMGPLNAESNVPGAESTLASQAPVAENPESGMSDRTYSGDSGQPRKPGDTPSPEEAPVLDSFEPETALPGFRPETPPPDFRPEPPASGFSPEPFSPSFRQEPPTPAFRPEPRAPTFRSELANPAFKSEPPPFDDEPERDAPDTRFGAWPPLPPLIPPPRVGATVMMERKPLVAILAVVAAIEAIAIVALLFTRPQPEPAPPVRLPVTIDSLQDGDSVVVNGQLAGVTPLDLQLGSDIRSIEIVPRTPPAQPSSTPTTAAPTRPGPAPAPQADALAQAAARQRSGGIRITSPIEVQVLEGDRVLGRSTDGPIVASAGRHDLELSNPAFGYRTRQQVDIKPGTILNLTVTPPPGRVSVNAVPWAQVWINGSQVGETPLANVSMPVGEHQITFRHPQLGERTEKFVVRSGALTRVSTTMGQ